MQYILSIVLLCGYAVRNYINVIANSFFKKILQVAARLCFSTDDAVIYYMVLLQADVL